MSITATKITATTVLKGSLKEEALPVISKDFNKVVSDLTAMDIATARTADTISETTAGVGVTVTGQRTPVISAGSSTLALTVEQSGSVVGLAKANGITVTLPACATASIGTRFKFLVAISCTSVGYVINTTGTDVFLGGVWSTIANPADAVDMEFPTSTTNKTITLNATTTGGLIGGWIELIMVSGTQWMVSGVTLGSGTIATPFGN